jgi:peptidoglycan/LPS O-acetylase OafA/YrhL
MLRILPHLIATMLLALVVACGTLAPLKPATFDDSVALTSQSITTVTTGANTLAERQQISKSVAKSVLTASQTASAALSLAQAAHVRGDMTEATTQLDMANSVLSGLKTFLVSKGAKP